MVTSHLKSKVLVSISTSVSMYPPKCGGTQHVEPPTRKNITTGGFLGSAWHQARYLNFLRLYLRILGGYRNSEQYCTHITIKHQSQVLENRFQRNAGINCS